MLRKPILCPVKPAQLRKSYEPSRARRVDHQCLDSWKIVAIKMPSASFKLPHCAHPTAQPIKIHLSCQHELRQLPSFGDNTQFQS
jgi:hypothetical protein